MIGFPMRVSKVTLTVGITVIIEDPARTIDDDMVAGETCVRFQPERLCRLVIVFVQERISQDVTSTAGEEHAIR